MKLPKSVEAYREICDEILGWLDGNWVHQDTFDQLSYRVDRKTSRKLFSFTPETICDALFPGQRDLAILKELVRTGLVTARESVSGSVEYRKAEYPLATTPQGGMNDTR